MTARRKVTSASHFGKKSVVDGYKFDSQKELDFYLRYIKNSGYEFEVQKNLVLVDKFPLGSHNVRSVSYKADFVVLEGSRIKHVYDVKNGFNGYAIDDKSQLKFKLVAQKYHVPVEVVVLRKHDFKVGILGTTKKIEVQARTNIDYEYSELIGWRLIKITA